MNKLQLIIILICVFLVSCQNTQTLPTTGEFQSSMLWFDRAFIQLMERWEIPGGALAVVSDGDILLQRGYGYADREFGEQVHPKSLFRIASLSKPITAVAVLMLVEDSVLSLNTPAFQILDDLQPVDKSVVDSRIADITIRNLLEHTAGWDSAASFDPMFMGREIAEKMGTQPPPDCATIIRYMMGQPLDFDPGTRYAYSNFGYCVLGRVIERVSGLDYEEYVQTQILMPVGIEEMHLGGTLLAERHPGEVHYYDDRADLVQSVFSQSGELTSRPYGGFSIEGMDAHGGWIASATDLARFASALESTNPAGVLSQESLSLIFNRADKDSYAYGWRIRPAGKDANWWSTGSMPGSTGILYRRSDGLIWAALFNTQPEAQGDEFIVDVITVMGRAAIMDEIIWIILAFLAILISVGFILVRKSKKAKIE